MMETTKGLLEEVEGYVKKFYEERISPEYVYHNFEHIREVVDAINQIAAGYDLTDKELEILRLAAWFHDTGYDQGPDQHEERSCEHAAVFLRSMDYPEEDLKQVLEVILATRVPYRPANLLQEIMCDADMSHLGNKTYWDRCGRVRQELNLTQKRLMSEPEWVEFELNFVRNHHYYTEVAQMMYEDRKQKHIRQLIKHRKRLHPEGVPEVIEEGEEDREEEKKKKKAGQQKKTRNDLKQLNLGRGVETMYRTNYRTHIALSSIADNKANIMLSINAIIISIVVSNLATKLDTNPQLIVPTLLLLASCLFSLIFAILSTRPKVTEGRFTREDIEKKKANLLFFGNFYRMDLEDFHWGMLEMIKDSDFLYSSMTRDLYYLGVVLAKKYQYLRICYSIFMFGLIISMIAFAIAYLPLWK